MSSIIIFADLKVGYQVVDYLIKNHSKDIQKVITLKKNDIFKLCLKNNIKCEIFESEEHLIPLLDSKKIEFGILAWWPKIISNKLINLPRKGFINLHNSFLPFNRGKHPYFWAFYEDSPYGVTIHKVDEGIDTGDIISQKLIEYTWEDNSETIYQKSLLEIVSLFKETYPKIKKNNFNFIKQTNKGTFHYAKELDEVSKISLDKKYLARDLFNIIRGRTVFNSSFPAAFFFENNEKFRVKIIIEKDN